jgi:hypothetical protein
LTAALEAATVRTIADAGAALGSDKQNVQALEPCKPERRSSSA